MVDLRRMVSSRLRCETELVLLDGGLLTGTKRNGIISLIRDAELQFDDSHDLLSSWTMEWDFGQW